MHKKAEELLKEVRKRKQQKADIHIKVLGDVSMSAEECKTLCGKIGLVYKDGFEDRVIQFRFTDATGDRHDEVVLPEGVNLKEFIKDPNILLQHDSWSFPIGKSLETVYDKEYNDVVGKVLFLTDDIDRTGMSESTFRMVKAGALKSGSIGFSAKPEDVRRASPEERKKYGLSEWGIIFDKTTLREFSIVTIGANPNATTISQRKGMYTETALETLKKKGLSDEHYNLLKADEIDTSEDAADTGENTTGNIPEGTEETETNGGETAEVNDTSEEKAMFTKEEVVELKEFLAHKDEYVKAGAVLSKKNKDIIKSVLSNIDALQGQLTKLLESSENNDTDNDKSDSNVSTEGIQNGLPEEQKHDKSDIYISLLDQMEEVISK